MKRGTCISVAKTADCQIRVVSVTAGQHPGRGYPRSNGWRSTTKRSKVQFGGCVWLGGGEDRPEWGTPPAPTRNWPDTLADANRTFRFGTCGPLFHSEPSLCGGEVPPFRSRFLAAPTRPSPKGTPRKCRSRPSCCAVTPSRVRDGVSSGVRTIPSDGDTCCGKGGRTRRLAGEFRRHDWGLSCRRNS